MHLKKEPLFEITIPSKTQAYMAAGKPVLMAVQGDAAELIREAGCGLVAKSESPRDIAEKAAMLAGLSEVELGQLGKNAIDYYQKELSLSEGVDRFVKVFQKVIGSHD